METKESIFYELVRRMLLSYLAQGPFISILRFSNDCPSKVLSLFARLVEITFVSSRSAVVCFYWVRQSSYKLDLYLCHPFFYHSTSSCIHFIIHLKPFLRTQLCYTTMLKIAVFSQ